MNLEVCHHGWHGVGNLSKCVPADALKMHSLALSFLRFLFKTFSKLFKFT